ncbi:unnamed protein product [Amoebophrya sp. A120]|nr:unnamed protein product [Amoebophrya sp. A120]|eukprot:GSA120T00002094001.1
MSSKSRFSFSTASSSSSTSLFLYVFSSLKELVRESSSGSTTTATTAVSTSSSTSSGAALAPAANKKCSGGLKRGPLNLFPASSSSPELVAGPPDCAVFTKENKDNAASPDVDLEIKFSSPIELTIDDLGFAEDFNMSSQKLKKEKSDGSLASTSSTANSGNKKCRWLRDVSKEYRILDEVMPSTHRGQAVHFGTRLKDGVKIVVKIREKLVSFKDSNDITTWKQSMENLLNWQDHFGEHIAGLYDLFEDATAYYVVMELVNGLDLFEFIHHVKMQDEGIKLLFVKKVAYECMRALSDYESLSLVHKDIKLENVVLMDTQKRGVLKVIDFDTVEEYGEDTRVYDVMGTDQYIAPESYYGYYTTASDIFALGVMLYKLCTGSFPFVDEIFDDEAGQNYVGHPKMRQIRGKLRLAKIDFTTHSFFHYDKQVKDFIKRCLVFDVHRRLTVKQALEHPLVRNYEEEAYQLKWTDFRPRKS